MSYYFFQQHQYGHVLKGKVRKITFMEDAGMLDLYILVHLPQNCITKEKGDIFVSPKPKKTEYAGFKKKVNEWVKNENNDMSEDHIFMKDYMPRKMPSCRVKLGPKKIVLKKLEECLNNHQVRY